MSAFERRLDLQMTLSGSLGKPIADMRVIGEFDRLQVVRFDQVASAIPDALVRLTVDLSETTIIDSAALGAMVRLKHSLNSIGAELIVIVEKPFQLTVMRVGGLVDFLGVTERPLS